MGSIERDRKRQSDSDGSRIDGRRSRMDGAASGARYGSKQVGTRLLAGYQASQYGRYERNTSDVPGPSTPVPYYLRRPHTHPNPPRRRERLKTRPESVSTIRWTYQAIRTCRGRSSDSNRSDTMYMDQRPCRSDSRPRNAKTRPLELIEDERIVDGGELSSLC